MAILWEGIGEYEGWVVTTDHPSSNGYPVLIYSKQSLPIPNLVGHKEAAAIMGWDTRRLTVERSRGKFPTPLVTLASGPVWVKQVIESYKDSRIKNNL